MAAGGLLAPSVIVVVVVGEGDLRTGRRAPAGLNHDVGGELAVGDGALLLGLVSKRGGEEETVQTGRYRRKEQGREEEGFVMGLT